MVAREPELESQDQDAGNQAPAGALTPPESGKPTLKPYKKAAAGVRAATEALAQTTKAAGFVRGTRTLLKLNKQAGFDCPGCAWPDPDHRATAEFCEKGAQHVADEITRDVVDPGFFARWSIAELGEQSDAWLNSQGRITHPMLRRPGASHYEPVDWDSAFRLIAETLNGLNTPNEAIFYTSGRTSNEAAFLYQLFVRRFGTNNMPDCSNMCHESSGAALKEVLGVGKGTVQLEDFTKADAIFILGQNPGSNHPRMLSSLREAKQRGCTIVTINPLREPGLLRFKHPQKVGDMLGSGTEISDLYIQARINSDGVLLAGIMKAMLELEDEQPGQVLDHDFMREHTTGFDALAEHLRAMQWAHVVEETGVAEPQIRQAAAIAARAQSTICCWAMGLTQHKNAVATIQQVVNFLLLKGNVGKPGAGACPVRGHSNVQGDRTVGISENMPGWFYDALEKEFEFSVPRAPGHDAVGAIEAMHRGDAKVFFGMGGNFLSATPDTAYTAKALNQCKLTVHVSTKLNRAHLVTGEQGLILPCLGRTERDEQNGAAQFVSVENSMGVVHKSEGKRPPASEHLLSEPQIVARMARATLGQTDPIDWETLGSNYDRLREHIEHVIPGFERYNERVRSENGFVLPNAARERRFNTRSGKAEFTVHHFAPVPLEDGQLLMMTIRSHNQFNTTVYDHDDRYRGIYGHRRVILMNTEDMRDRNLEEGQRVSVTSHWQGTTRSASDFVAVPFDIPKRCTATYFPEANVLVPVDSYAEKSRTPTSKSVVITVEASGS